MKKDLNFLKANLIAHRGIHNNKNIPENSLEAFKIAIEKNYTIELDCHLLKDNTIVVFHDDNLKRLTNINKPITDCSYEEISKLYLLDTRCRIPVLSEVLELINGRVPVIIELKSDRKTGKLEKELIKILDNYKEKFAIKSFNPFSIRWFKNIRPNYIRGLLINYDYNNLKEFVISKMFFWKLAKPDFLSVNYKFYNNKKILKLRDKLPILAWTIRDKKTYKLVKDLFDNCICENIDSLE